MWRGGGVVGVGGDRRVLKTSFFCVHDLMQRQLMIED